MNKVLLAFILSFIISSNVFGQVGEIINELGKPSRDHSSSSSSSGGSDIGAQLIFDGIRLIGIGLYSLQTAVLSTRNEHPEIVSIEGFLQAGYYDKYNALLLNPQIRANWGAFSTEVRQQSISDKTGYLSTLDWQIVKLNIPIQPVVLSFGMGFSNVINVKRTFFEYTLGGKVRFLKEKVCSEVNYRSTDGYRSSCFRKEFKASFDYEIKRSQIRNKGSFRASPMVGFMYQNYYGKIDQYFLLVGINIRYF